MRDTSENMIEILNVSKADNIYSSLIRLKISGELLNLRFGIDPIDFGHLKRILEFRPFENTGVAPYRYFFALSYSRDEEHDNLAYIFIRVEQLERHKQYMFRISKKYVANLLWFNSLTDKKQIEEMIVKSDRKQLILGAIIGDIIGSVFEWHNVKTTDFKLFTEKTDFTDDSVLTFATMDSILNGIDYATAYQDYGRKYPNRGYGGYFNSWIHSDHPEPYNSYGNGSAMRVSPVGWAYDTMDEVLQQAKRSAEVTHNHPEGIKGAQATATAIFLARTGSGKAEIKQYIQDKFGYDLERRLDDIRPVYHFNETCQETVPEAIIAFLESEDYESAIRLAISIGGDSDTVACITGGIAEAFYREIPEWIVENALRLLPVDVVEMIKEFSLKYRRFK